MTTWIDRYQRQAEERYRRLDAVLAELRDDSETTHTRAERNRIMSTHHHPEAQIEADADRPVIRITRDFRPPRPSAAGAHRPGAVRAVGRTGPSTPRIDYWDARTGGSWRYVAARDGEEFAFRGTSTRSATDQIVQTFTWEGMPDGVALETLTFEDLGDGRTRLHAPVAVDSFEGRDAWLASGMEVGVNEGYAKLDQLLAEG